MAISGQIYGITDPKTFFTAVLLGQKPSSGFTTLSNLPLQVSMWGRSQQSQSDFTHAGTVTAANSSFTIPDFLLTVPDEVAINVSISGSPLYRSTVFTYARAQQGGLDIYVNQPAAVGITADEISQQLQGVGLPQDTLLTSNPWGVWVAGDQQGADVQFGVRLVAHTSTNLNVFVDPVLDGYNIHVGFPADCKVNADEILAQIKTSLAQQESPLNAFIKTSIMGVLSSMAGNLAQQLYGIISITFTSIRLPNQHTWPLNNPRFDTTTVISIGPTIGYPQKW